MGRLYLYTALVIMTLAGFLMGHFIKMTGYQVQTGNFTANVISAVACTFSTDALNVSFGDRITSNSNYNATKNFFDGRNHTLYNVTADSTNTVDTNISIKGNHFVSGSGTFGIGNISWTSNTSQANGTNMLYPGTANISTSYDTTNLIAISLTAGSTVWYRMWLRLPSGTQEGQYKGNYTLRCLET